MVWPPLRIYRAKTSLNSLPFTTFRVCMYNTSFLFGFRLRIAVGLAIKNPGILPPGLSPFCLDGQGGLCGDVVQASSKVVCKGNNFKTKISRILTINNTFNNSTTYTQHISPIKNTIKITNKNNDKINNKNRVKTRAKPSQLLPLRCWRRVPRTQSKARQCTCDNPMQSGVRRTVRGFQN